MNGEDDLDLKQSASQQLPKSVSFAHPLADYDQDIDDLVEISSSDVDSLIDEADPYTFVDGNRDRDINERGLHRSTYLERYDYKALLESLRIHEQHDTAKHLMSASMVRRGRIIDEMQIPDSRKLRKGWTAWPLSPQETHHSRNANFELREEIKAVVHAIAYKKLREEGQQICADELPDPVANLLCDTVHQQVETLLGKVSDSRTYQGGLAASTVQRLDLIDYRHILMISDSLGVLSSSALARLKTRCEHLFGVDEDSLQPEVETSIDMKPEFVPMEIVAGAGSWHLRGSKRRQIVEVRDENSDPEAPSVHVADTPMQQVRPDVVGAAVVQGCDVKKRRKIKITADSGQRFHKGVQLIPANMIKRENQEAEHSFWDFPE